MNKPSNEQQTEKAIEKILPSFEGIPKGNWILLSDDMTRIVSFDSNLGIAIAKAKQSGEPNPVLVGRQS